MIPLLLILATTQASATDTARVLVTPAPTPAYIEDTGYAQRLNLDFVIENVGSDTLDLVSIELSVYDAEDHLAFRHFIDNNGFSPSILTIPEREWVPGARHLVFNPFAQFEPTIDLARLEFTFRFDARGEGGRVEARATVRPVAFESPAELTLPLSGRLLVWDGHDALSHHRRFDATHPVAAQFGFRSNFMRYAHDLVVVDSLGAMHTGDGDRNEDYHGFGAPVFAPADGLVAALYDGQPDNEGHESLFDPSLLMEHPMGLFGNYIVIDHGGAYSMLGHVRNGSVAVGVGDRVRQGQQVAAVGSSGSSYFPHLHYELRTGAGVETEGLPAYFVRFDRILGSRTVAVDRGPVDSGQQVKDRSRR